MYKAVDDLQLTTRVIWCANKVFNKLFAILKHNCSPCSKSISSSNPNPIFNLCPNSNPIPGAYSNSNPSLIPKSSPNPDPKY